MRLLSLRDRRQLRGTSRDVKTAASSRGPAAGNADPRRENDGRTGDRKRTGKDHGERGNTKAPTAARREGTAAREGQDEGLRRGVPPSFQQRRERRRQGPEKRRHTRPSYFNILSALRGITHTMAERPIFEAKEGRAREYPIPSCNRCSIRGRSARN